MKLLPVINDGNQGKQSYPQRSQFAITNGMSIA